MSPLLFLASPLGTVLLLTAGAVVVLLLARFLSTRPVVATALGLLVVLGVVGVAFLNPAGPASSVLALCAVAAVSLLLVSTLDLELSEHVAEVTALLLLATAGGVTLANAGDLLQAVLGLETLALSAVILVAVSRGARAIEAAFKYFVLGAISLAALVYGIGLVYLGTGSFAFPTAAQVSGSPLVLAGAVLVGLGFAFELAVFPFHWGGLDAYTAATPGLAGSIMSASKLAAAYALGLLVTRAGAPVGQVLVWVGTLTIAWGTFGAIAQRDLRRLLAYSAITHAGFIALAVGSGQQGPRTAIFYAAIYGSMAMLTFAALSGRQGDLPLAGIKSAGFTPLRAGALALGLLSLSGIPPTPGFWAKLAVLVVAWQAAGPIPTLVAVAGGVFSVLYYLRPVPDLLATIRESLPSAPPRPAGRAAPAIVVAGLAVVTLGLFPALAWALARGLPAGG